MVTQLESERRGRERRPRSEVARVKSFLERLARALIAGDLPILHSMWDSSALVLGYGDAHAVKRSEEIESFFQGAKDLYDLHGIVRTRAEILSLNWVSEHIAVVTVRWFYLDERGDNVAAETSTYTLRVDEDGQLRVRVVFMHPEPGP